MLDNVGAYICVLAEDTHWIIDGVSDHVPVKPMPYTDHGVRVEAAEEMLLHGEKHVQSIFLDSDTAPAPEVVPPFIAQLPDLRCLFLPSQIAPSLRPEMIGPHVKALSFYGRYDTKYWNNKTVSLSSEAPFSGIEALSGDTRCYRVENRFRFDPAIFPNLRYLGFTFDAKRQFADTLRALPHLISVSAAGFDSIDGLADLVPCQNLISLTLAWNSKIETLQGIERFPNLRYLKLVSLTKLQSLDAVVALQGLEFVGVYWSKRVEKAEVLIELPAVIKINAFGNNLKEPSWQRLKQAAAARGIDVRNMI